MDEAVRAIITLDSGDGDVYGWAMGHWCGIADALYRAGEATPAAWEFRPGLLLDAPEWPDSEYGDGLASGDFDADALRHAGDVLARYVGLCRVLGLDY